MIKREKYFFVTLLFLFIIFISLCIYNYTKILDIDNLTVKLNSTEKKLSELSEILYIENSLDHDIGLAKEEFSKLVTVIKEQKKIWSEFNNPNVNLYKSQKQISPSSVNANLVILQNSLKSRCQDNVIKLNHSSYVRSQDQENNNESKFGFGFSSYIGFWPSFNREEANLLDIQSKIIKEIVEALSSSGANEQSIELNYIKRESVGPIDKNFIDRDLVTLPKPEYLLRKEGFIDTFCFEISFTGITDNARSFINQLSSPFSVRKLNVKRKDELQNNAQISIFDDVQDDDSILPIIRDIKSTFNIHLEYVKNVNLEINSFFDSNKFSNKNKTSIKNIFSEIENAF